MLHDTFHVVYNSSVASDSYFELLLEINNVVTKLIYVPEVTHISHPSYLNDSTTYSDQNYVLNLINLYM